MRKTARGEITIRSGCQILQNKDTAQVEQYLHGMATVSINARARASHCGERVPRQGTPTPGSAGVNR